MTTNTSFSDLKSEFKKLLKIPGVRRLTATYFEGEWHLGDWPRNRDDKKRLQESFISLAQSGVSLVGEEGYGDALNQWLNLLAFEFKALKKVETANYGSSDSGYIENVCQVSSDCCAVLGNRVAARYSPPLRTPDLETSQKRLALLNQLTTELVAIKERTQDYCTAATLKREFPHFKLWKCIDADEIAALAADENFRPKAYATNIVLREFRLESRETLKKDRRKLKKASQLR